MNVACDWENRYQGTLCALGTKPLKTLMNSETGLLYGLLSGLVVQTFRNYQMHFLKQKACSEKWHSSYCLRGPAGSGILENINIKGLFFLEKFMMPKLSIAVY